jgi:2-polyprenyl-3-methyl-5-hydroxy-6-metoxy-1,4-benzoquinol methylase
MGAVPPKPNRPAAALEPVVRAFAARSEMRPVIEFLLADLDDLGTTAAAAAAFLRPLRLQQATVLELGCGKGALSVKLAEEVKLEVTGVDTHEPALEEARARAQAHGVAERCQFRCDDLRAPLAEAATYDVVLALGLAHFLGGPAAATRALRAVVRAGGRMLVDLDCLATAGKAVPGYEAALDREETTRLLTSHGDTVVMRWDWPPETTRRDNLRNTEAIRARVAEARARWPERAADIDAFVSGQEARSAVLGDTVQSALWVLLRGA